jgi:hypothetical protein
MNLRMSYLQSRANTNMCNILENNQNLLNLKRMNLMSSKMLLRSLHKNNKMKFSKMRKSNLMSLKKPNRNSCRLNKKMEMTISRHLKRLTRPNRLPRLIALSHIKYNHRHHKSKMTRKSSKILLKQSNLLPSTLNNNHYLLRNTLNKYNNHYLKLCKVMNNNL